MKTELINQETGEVLIMSERMVQAFIEMFKIKTNFCEASFHSGKRTRLQSEIDAVSFEKIARYLSARKHFKKSKVSNVLASGVGSKNDRIFRLSWENFKKFEKMTSAKNL